jgi:hypothetical protein
MLNPHSNLIRRRRVSPPAAGKIEFHWPWGAENIPIDSLPAWGGKLYFQTPWWSNSFNNSLKWRAD